MAYSVNDVPAADVARANADNVILVGDHVLQASGVAGRWNTDGNLATADDTDAAWPVRYAFDRRLDTPTKRATGATVSWLVFDRGAGALADFDVALVSGNFADITCTQVDLGIADDGDVAGGSNADIIETWNSGLGKRLVSRDLRDTGGLTNRRFTDVRYLGLKVTCSGSEKPEVYEFWLGKRVQLHGRELLPVSSILKGASYGVFRSAGGSEVRAVTASGFERGMRSFKFKDATFSAEVNTFLSQIQYGGRPFLYLHEPNTDVRNAVVFFGDVELVDTGGSVGTRTLTLSGMETAPFYSSES